MENQMRFKGKKVIITGASRNTGVGIARLFIREGADVITSGSTAESTERGAEQLRSEGFSGFNSFPCDIGDEKQVDALFDFADKTFGGRLDILVNNACDQGIGPSFIDMTGEYFLKVVKTNLLGNFMMSQRAAKRFLKQDDRGVIVNVGSNTSTRAIRNRTAYIASKGGIDSLTRSMALDLAPLGIRVNMCAPGYIYTDRWDALDEGTRERRRKNCPLRQEAKAEDVAQVVAFLASDASRNMTGERIVVDAGCSCQHMPEDVDR
jgi:NAD(P)-dependent dehydrogenase (short-subunit alcohol dehydrogenase family)